MATNEKTTGLGPSGAPEPTKSLIVQKVNTLQSVIDEDFVQRQLKGALGDNAAGFAASIIDLYSGDKNLQEADPKLLVFQCLKAAVLRLPINKQLGFAWIIAYKGIPQFQIGYKGLVQLAIRTGQYRILNAGRVYQGELRSQSKLTGEFDLDGKRSGDKVIGYFAHMELKVGFSKTVYASTDEVKMHAKRYSKTFGKDTSTWTTHFDEMAIKTQVRNLLGHWGYLTTELAQALETDDEYDDGMEDAADQAGSKARGRAGTKTAGFTEAEVMSTTSNGEATDPYDDRPDWAK